MLAFALALMGFALFIYFIAFVVMPRMRKGREKSFDAFMMFESVRFWFTKL